MFLTSLSLQGFKSFATRTTLEFEPGVTVIVGPNGSGKSNVVDALAWCLGTASPSKVRGGSMADVIFAGARDRAPARSALVELTIDNAAGVLGHDGVGAARSAQEFAEVRVSRQVDADGASTYRINGQEVRALDVQELLSDAGLGRELHTIVGQGQLDEILHAKPEERRRYIEEAAGILKHRRRRERALRKLDQVDEHIDKLGTVLRELRRQLRPLERQAEAADRHAQLQAELRDVRGRLAAARLAELRSRRAAEADGDAAAAAELDGAEGDLRRLTARADGLEADIDELVPGVESAQATYYELSSLQERLRGTAELIDARRRHLVEYVEEPLTGRPPGELRARAAELDDRVAELGAQAEDARGELTAATAARHANEQARADHARRLEEERRRRHERRERRVKWESDVAAARRSLETVDDERGRVAGRLRTLEDERAALDGDVVAAERALAARRADVDAARAAVDDVRAAIEVAERALEEAVAEDRRLERERAEATARAEALAAAVAAPDGAGAALLDGRLAGVLGTLAEHVRVADGAERALAAALAGFGDDAIAVADRDAAVAAVAWLRDRDLGGATLFPTDVRGRASAPAPPPGAVAAASFVRSANGTPQVAAALTHALRDVWVVPTWADAVRAHRDRPEATFVTRDGDVAGPHLYRGGGAASGSALVAATRADEARARARALDPRVEACAAALEDARRRRDELRRRLERTRAARDAAQAEAQEAERARAQIASVRGARAGQIETLVDRLGELDAARAEARRRLEGLAAREPAGDADADADVGEDAAATGTVELERAVEAARERETEARLRLDRTEERRRHAEEQVDALRREADEVERAVEQAERRRERRRGAIARCGVLTEVAEQALKAVASSIDEAARRRDGLAQRLRDARRELDGARTRRREQVELVDALRERRHAADLRRAELDHELDRLGDRVRDELGVSVEELAAEHPDADGFDVDELGAREDVLVRKLGMLGRVNPLALEEFRALEERHAFLAGQLDDLRGSRRDLEQVVAAVDERIEEVFAEAYRDVAAAFAEMFAIVFPGGDGRLTLTEPDDLLRTGIEVEARPPGKKVTRLSLLSGGERSLTVLAFVFAIFRARPSPFYVLDEVDAALDDVNLQRLLRVIQTFRGASQIIMVTHQKRSMEIADLLYGITMGPDAVTKAVRQRLAQSSVDLRDEPDHPTTDALPAAVG